MYSYKRNIFNTTILVAAISLGIQGCKDEEASLSTKQAEPSPAMQSKNQIDIWPRLEIEAKSDPAIEKKVSELLSTMTLEQKVAQMIQPEIRDITVEDMRKYGFGSYLNGGGAFPNNDKQATPEDWIALAEDFYQASIDDSFDGSTIPTMWGTDAVHGHNNVIGATLFPHNIGLGAANNPQLIERIAEITAKEVMVTGIDWVFAPTVAVVRDDRWGRTYEGYSEDPEIVRDYAASIVKGLQGHADKDFLGNTRVISTVKHFLGDGGTVGGDDQGDNIASEQELFDIHAQGYVGGLTAGAQSVMASFNSWHGDKIHGNKYLLTDVLKDKFGFDGFVVGDWNGHGQIKGCTNESCAQAVNAGLDIFMVPTDAWKPLYENTIAQVKGGEIAIERIDDAVSRILRVKFRAGLFDKPSPAKRELSGKRELIGTKAHRDVARQAVRESLVLLKNSENLLPLSPKQHILFAGDSADNIGKQSGGWSITWQGTGNVNSDFPGGSSIYQGFKEQVSKAGGEVTLSVDGKYQVKPDVAVVVFGEEPYAEGHGDRDNLEYQRGNKRDLALLQKLKADGIPVVAVFISGRPMWVNAELNASDAFVAAWLPGSEGDGVAEVLLTKADGELQYDFSGELSFSWPRLPSQTTVNRFDDEYSPLLPYGFGLKYGEESTLADNLSEDSGLSEEGIGPMALFELSARDPWVFVLNSGAAHAKINKSVQALGAVSYKTLDMQVQEDALSVKFDGSDKASLSLNSNFAEDFSTYFALNSVLTFNVRVDNPANKAVMLAMVCEGINSARCEAELNISEKLAALPKGTWQTVSIDLACFSQETLNMTTIVRPFQLSTDGELGLSFSRIAVEPQQADDEATISCQ